MLRRRQACASGTGCGHQNPEHWRGHDRKARGSFDPVEQCHLVFSTRSWSCSILYSLSRTPFLIKKFLAIDTLATGANLSTYLSTYRDRTSWSQMGETGKPLDNSVKRPKAGGIVAQRSRRSILLGELEEGEILPQESELAEAFPALRPTPRQAFRILESEGSITISRGRPRRSHRAQAKGCDHVALVRLSPAIARRHLRRRVPDAGFRRAHGRTLAG